MSGGCGTPSVGNRVVWEEEEEVSQREKRLF